MIDRRRWIARWLGAFATGAFWRPPSIAAPPSVSAPASVPASALASAPASPPGARILRVPFRAAETGFDPAQISDLYSNTVCAHIFEAMFGYDPLAVPLKVRPLTAAALPEVSSDFRTWTIRLQPGIFFADDPAFRGTRRELVAADYAYAFKRYYDPATRAAGASKLVDEGIAGLAELRDRALRDKVPFDYDAPLDGLRVVDRHTLQIRLLAPRPRFLHTLCTASYGAIAREVVAFHGDQIMAHPVGTGPYRLKEWRRSSRIVLEKNPGFRELHYDAAPAPDDAEGQAWLARLKGRRLPLNDGVEISVVEESQPRWLAFLRGQFDFVLVPQEFMSYAMPGSKLAPNLAKRRIFAHRYVNPDYTMTWFNMDDPVVGGYGADRVALRRALSLAYDVRREIGAVRRGQAVAAQAPVPPGVYGHDAAYRSENSTCDPARAKALLDLYGYVDRDGDGWREQPDGTPLVLHMATQASLIEHQLAEMWEKSLSAIGVRIRFETAQWPENLKAARAGKLQMWSLASTSTSPDGQQSLDYMYGPSVGSGNYARFRLPAFDAIYRRLLMLPDGPERASLFLEASKLVTAYMPYRILVHRVNTDLNHPWLTGFRQPLFRNDLWQYIDIDVAMRERLTA